jgi:hypothetical protein
MYRAKTEKYKNKTRRKEAQKVQIAHKNDRMQDKGRGNGQLPLPFLFLVRIVFS